MRKTWFYYNSLATEQEKEAYKAVLASVYAREDTAVAKAVFLDQEQVDNVLRAIEYDCPELYYATLMGENAYYYRYNNGDLELHFSYLFPLEEQKKRVRKVNAFIEYLLSNIPDKVRPSEYLTALWLHDLLVKNIRYDYDALDAGSKERPEAFSIEGGLKGKKAVCSGVAKLYMMLCERMNIWCIYVSGTTIKSKKTSTSSDEGRGGRHGWNLLWLDGKYSYVDVTWDLQDDDDTFVSHVYFGMSDEQCFRKRKPDCRIRGVRLPQCKEPNPNNYFIRSHNYLYDASGVERYVRRMIKMRAPSFEFQLSARNAPPEQLHQEMLQFVRRIMQDADGVRQWTLYCNEQMYTFQYDLEYY